MDILGMSYMYHDSAACLLRDGQLVAGAAEERFIRIKHTVEFPIRAIRYCLEEGDIDVNDLEAIVFYEKPYLKFDRILRTHLAVFPRSYKSFRHFLPMWLNYKLRVPQIIRDNTGFRGKILFTDHHYAHAASTFLPSPFERALVLTTDGTGEWSTLAFGTAEGTNISLNKDIRFPHSLGLLYSAVTAHLGFKVNGGEGKVMGLASYGEPRFRKAFEDVITIREDGSFKLNMDYFAYHYDLVMTTERFAQAFGPVRVPESELEQRHMDLAATLQDVVEEVLLKVVRHAHSLYGIDKLCIAGGVGLNCVANGRILAETPIHEVFVQPGSGDDGGSLGAALYAYTQLFGGKERWRMTDPYLGPSWSDDAIARFLDGKGLSYTSLPDEAALAEHAAGLLADGQILGWFQGRMEFGPRALGNRSILADPRREEMKDVLNAKVKHREGFRPFAPSVLAEHATEWFELDSASPFMLLAADVREAKRAEVPAITHVDGSARVQTVTAEQNPRYHALIQAFHEATGVPIVVNTSFNVRGEPIVCTPEHALDCFLRTKMDYLVLGSHVVSKAEVNA